MKDSFEKMMEKLYDRKLTKAELEECERNLVGFFKLLIEIDREQGGD